MNSILPDISIIKEEQNNSESDNAENDNVISYLEGYHVLLPGENTNIVKIECDAVDTETVENTQLLPKPHEIKIERSDFTIKLEPAVFCESVDEQDIDNHTNPLNNDLPHYDTMLKYPQSSSSVIISERGTPFIGEYEVEFINPNMEEFPNGHNLNGKMILFICGNQRIDNLIIYAIRTSN